MPVNGQLGTGSGRLGPVFKSTQAIGPFETGSPDGLAIRQFLYARFPAGLLVENQKK